MVNLYVVLGVRREATLDEIKRAYRRLARRYHPGVNPGDRDAAELFRRISLAYETLSDPERRKRYDVQGEGPEQSVIAAFEFQGFDFSVAVEGSRASTFGELFADALSGRVTLPAAGIAEAGADLHAAITIGFEDAIRGGRREVATARLERCAPCNGLGRLPGAETGCAHCEGSGHVRTARGHMVFTRVCPACRGLGSVRHHTCRACGGEGLGVHESTIGVGIPPGIQDGTQLTIPGEGHAGRRGGPAGALHLTVHVKPHPFFRRVGDDIHVDVPVAIHEAALGARVEVPGVHGSVRLRIPPGTQSGQTFRLRDRGAPAASGRLGDLIVTVRLVLPRLLDERSRELLREFGVRNPENVRELSGMVASSPATGDQAGSRRTDRSADAEASPATGSDG